MMINYLPMSLINTESMLTKSEGGPTIRSIDLVMDFLMQIVHDIVCDSRDQQTRKSFWVRCTIDLMAHYGVSRRSSRSPH